MISHKYRCIFVEVPKTGTTSIRSIIGSGRPPHMDLAQKQADIIYGHNQYGGAASLLNYILPKKKRKKTGEEKFKSYFKFGLARNPWDRTVSLYKRREGVQLSEQMSFEEFIDWIQYASATCVYPSPHRNQLDWFTTTRPKKKSIFLRLLTGWSRKKILWVLNSNVCVLTTRSRFPPVNTGTEL